MSEQLPKSFIKATATYNTFEKAVAAPYIRKSFLSDINTTAVIYVAACGFYELYFNGIRYTKGYFAPYISNPDHYIYCDCYEIPIAKGENVIGLLLGNGFMNNPGGYIWEFDKAPFRDAPMVAVSVSYQNANGEMVSFESDTTFKTMESPIRSDDYRFGEYYDANYEIPGWNLKEFDDSAWNPAISAKPPRGEIRLCTAEPIVKTEEIRPQAIFQDGDSFIYDFGVIHAGICQLKIKGTKGQKIELQHGELIKDGTLSMENVWFVREFWERDKEMVHKDTYICKGDTEEYYTPTFTYHGFRYVKVSGITPKQATEELLTYWVLHSDLNERGGFVCSNETVNCLQKITRRSDISNFHYFPTDCPQREKNGWTADAALSTEHMLLNLNPETSYREWLRNICKAQNQEGAIPGIVPTGGWGYEWGSGPAWDCVLVYLPYYVYQYRGTTEMICESASSIMAYLHFLTTKADEKGLLHFGLGDWRPVGYFEAIAPLELTDSIISMDIAEKSAVLFQAVGMDAQADFAQAIAENIKQAIRTHLIDFNSMVVHGNMQTCQALALYYRIFTPEEEEKAFAQLLRMIHEKDDHFDVGVLGGRVIFHVLSKFGYSELALKMIIGPDFPSYGYWLKQGATTLWESFFPDMVESMNHHFWGDISAWFIKSLAGIHFNPKINDIHTVELRPSFVSQLNFAEGFYEAPDGEIRSSWKRVCDTIEWTLTIPQTMKATAVLEPGYIFSDGNSSAVVTSGTYQIRKG